MEKFNSLLRNDSGEAKMPVFLFIGLSSLGFTIGSQLARHLEHADERVKDIQVTNTQLHTELDRTFDPVTGLTVNDKGQTFEFDSKASTGTDEHCTGKYDAQNDIAIVSGKIACTQLIVSQK
jgi:hypothetical protein